jgi:N,N'-diacetyllegionaminate synthase
VTDTWLHIPRNAAPCIIIAEVAQAHDGSRCRRSDAINFQTHIAAAESTPAASLGGKASGCRTKRASITGAALNSTPSSGLALKRHSDERGLLLLNSPFSMAALELL